LKQQKGVTPSLVISLPLERPSSQSTTKPGTLLDAEISSAKTTIATLEVSQPSLAAFTLNFSQMENQNLRLAIEDLTVTFEEFQSKMTRELYEKSQSISAMQLQQQSQSQSTLSCLEQAKYVESRLDATTALLNVTSPKSDPTHDSIEHVRHSSPARAGYHNPSLLGTPMARPLNWIVKQATTEVKLLRKRAENLHWYIPPAKENGVLDGDDDDDALLIANKENSNLSNETQPGDPATALPQHFTDLTRRYQGKLIKLKHQLEEAVSVICEQDRLIHAGSSSSLPPSLILSLDLSRPSSLYLFSSSGR
jgi:hypothetical protein